MVDVVATDAFADWFRSLDGRDAKAVARKVDLLEMVGFALGHPHASSIKNSSIALRELRVQSGGRPLRVFYAFDPARQAVLLIGGDKTGDKRFYDKLVPRAEQLWRQYLAETGQEES